MKKYFYLFLVLTLVCSGLSFIHFAFILPAMSFAYLVVFILSFKNSLKS